MESQVGLCGQVGACQRLCLRAPHCPLGQARARQLLGAQRQRRQLRRLVVGRAIEANILRAAGSFRAYQLQLKWERDAKAKEVKRMKERIIWLKPGQDVSYCPYCHSRNIRISEDGGYSSCNACEGNFVVRHRKAQPAPKPRSISPEELWALQRKANSEDKAG